MDPSRTDTTALLQSIDKKLGILLALAIDERLPERSRASKRSLDEVLHTAGLTPTEIGALMGKTRQAVQQVLAAAEGAGKSAAVKARGGNGKKASSSGGAR